MCTPRSVLLTSLFLFLIADMGDAQWVQTNGPTGGSITSFAAMGTKLFAGSHGGGVLLYTNNGDSWTPVNSGLM